MTKAQHIARHELLHKMLDELAADWMDNQPAENAKLFSETSIMELMKWSYEQTQNPSTPRR